MSRFCTRCGSTDHDLSQCRWPILLALGTFIASCIIAIMAGRQ